MGDARWHGLSMTFTQLPLLQAICGSHGIHTLSRGVRLPQSAEEWEELVQLHYVTRKLVRYTRTTNVARIARVLRQAANAKDEVFEGINEARVLEAMRALVEGCATAAAAAGEGVGASSADDSGKDMHRATVIRPTPLKFPADQSDGEAKRCACTQGGVWTASAATSSVRCALPWPFMPPYLIPSSTTCFP